MGTDTLAPLGTTIAKIASETPPERGVILRFLLQEEAQRLLPDEKVFWCLRRLAPVNQRMGEKSPVYDHVEVHYDATKNHASYRNLILCERLWICPVCASRISEFRRQAITQAINGSGLYSALVTFTLQHRKHTPLAATLGTLSTAYRKFKSGRWWTDFVQEWGWVGDIRALEVTYGEHGWHPHFHVISLFNWFLGKQDVSRLENALKGRFGDVLRQSGGYATYANGVTVKDDMQYARDYIAKFGRMPTHEDVKGWTIEHELTGANRKVARSKSGITPWGLLYQSAMGSKESARLFLEFANATKGRNQVCWSRGLRSRLDMDSVETALQDQENSSIALLTIDKYWWTEICQRRLRGQILAKVKEYHGDFAAIENWIIQEMKK